MSGQLLSPWLDLARFPQRRFLAGLDRSHRPLAQSLQPGEVGAREVAAREVAAQWSALLRCEGQAVAPADVIILSSQAELWGAALTLLLAPGDPLLLAEPVPTGALRAIVQAGAAWLDVGRTAAGDVDELALARAAQAHPQAIYFAQQPQPMGQAQAWPPPGLLRAAVADLQLAGWPRQIPKATAVLLALRAPDAPGQVLAHAVVCAPGLGPGLELLLGPAQLPESQVALALAALQTCAQRPQEIQRAEEALAQKAQRLTGWTAEWPGLHGAGQRGMQWSAQCLGGDAQRLLEQLRGRATGLRAYGPHPGQNLLVADLWADFAEVAG